MKNRNVLYAQSGGVTSVINATAAGVLEAGRKSKRIGKIFAAKNGILGALNEEIIDTSFESDKEIYNYISNGNLLNTFPMANIFHHLIITISFDI